ncbi:flagellar basal-body MS-ring/collar protein FliF [Bosea sp. (in: a-proteobacteria)]|uniref:flagellar basal-body MS-ring/collar protein FliF n=1 Tax=Bosea sp. (in: a-proteobacteria) TaxID=1871050 RepID=UPI002736F549|nr:flagellar basal-body MS-ring/collar protein FliF [Bosea sp. (in: a-proteobacteria)]MDP3408777.1 flagellar basal-body MS-ring/collar protein FliF [Bosea sp. (in: a-proteobacteria)]
MPGRHYAEEIWLNLQQLGPRRLAALAAIGLFVFAAIGISAYYLSRPEMSVLYSGLQREDVNRIGAALQESGVVFDVNSEGTQVLVKPSQAAQARMLLAEKGLPRSTSGGYELFDKLGSLGLTSFMQEITRVRAMEGELARTIQLMRGVKAASVHLVLADKGSFRRDQQPASASVVVRTETSGAGNVAQAIRHLVASAVPGLSTEKVTVLNTDGTLLATGGEAGQLGSAKLAGLQQSVNREIQDNVRKALTPYLGLENFEISVATDLNTDRKETSETVFNPDSKVERSVRVVRENDTSQNAATQEPTTVEQNVPERAVRADGGQRSSEEKQRREELTNYEISSKKTQTVSDGYAIAKMSIAVLINRPRLIESLGAAPTPDVIEARLEDVRQVVASAAGVNGQRGDNIKVLAVDFLQGSRTLEPTAPIGVGETLLRQSGTLINAVTILGLAALIIWFGLRPSINAILKRPTPPALTTLAEDAAVSGVDPQLQIAGGEIGLNLIGDLTSASQRSPLRKLEQLIDFNEVQAAAILKQWIHEGERA